MPSHLHPQITSLRGSYGGSRCAGALCAPMQVCRVMRTLACTASSNRESMAMWRPNSLRSVHTSSCAEMCACAVCGGDQQNHHTQLGKLWHYPQPRSLPLCLVAQQGAHKPEQLSHGSNLPCHAPKACLGSMTPTRWPHSVRAALVLSSSSRSRSLSSSLLWRSDSSCARMQAHAVKRNHGEPSCACPCQPQRGPKELFVLVSVTASVTAQASLSLRHVTSPYPPHLLRELPLGRHKLLHHVRLDPAHPALHAAGACVSSSKYTSLWQGHIHEARMPACRHRVRTSMPQQAGPLHTELLPGHVPCIP